MYTARTLDGSLEDMFNPAFRKVDFSDSSAVITIATYLRHSWIATPPASENNSYTQTDIGAFIRSIQNETVSEREARPKNPDMTIHTPWRDTVYEMWNHVFVDVMRFLPEVHSGIGHFHPPSFKVLPLLFEGLATKWETNVLIIPTFLAKGVELRMTKNVDECGEEGELTFGSFDGGNPYEIWCLREAMEVKFHLKVGDEHEEKQEGLAAVLVVAILCSDEHEATNEEENARLIEED